jgi:hypothetical protein
LQWRDERNRRRKNDSDDDEYSRLSVSLHAPFLPDAADSALPCGWPSIESRVRFKFVPVAVNSFGGPTKQYPTNPSIRFSASADVIARVYLLSNLVSRSEKNCFRSGAFRDFHPN